MFPSQFPIKKSELKSCVILLLRVSACGPDLSRWRRSDPCHRMITGPPTGCPEVSAPASHVQVYHSFVQVCRTTQRIEALQSFWVIHSRCCNTLMEETSQILYSILKFHMFERGPTFSSAARPRPVSVLGFHHSGLALRCQPGRI